jgi:hypothetical protein
MRRSLVTSSESRPSRSRAWAWIRIVWPPLSALSCHVSRHSSESSQAWVWLTPNRQQIWNHGIAPDQPVPLLATVTALTPDDIRTLSAADLTASQDTQLLRALQVVGTQVATP